MARKSKRGDEENEQKRGRENKQLMEKKVNINGRKSKGRKNEKI